MEPSTIRLARFYKDLTLNELSQATGINPSTLSLLERGLLPKTASTEKIRERVTKVLGGMLGGERP
jgi:transcriptional regulator with XRE-family HTH domain